MRDPYRVHRIVANDPPGLAYPRYSDPSKRAQRVSRRAVALEPRPAHRFHMAGMHAYQRVDRSFFETMRFSFDVEVELDCSPDQLFAVFEDAHAWTVWAAALKKVEWTSPKPFGPGATRTVTLPGGRVADEVFFAWEHGKHMAFYFERGNMPLEAFAENYDVTDLGNGRCKLLWTVALIPTGAGKVLLPISRPIMQWQLNGMMKSLQKYIARQAFEGAAPAAAQ